MLLLNAVSSMISMAAVGAQLSGWAFIGSFNWPWRCAFAVHGMMFLLASPGFLLLSMPRWAGMKVLLLLFE